MVYCWWAHWKKRGFIRALSFNFYKFFLFCSVFRHIFPPRSISPLVLYWLKLWKLLETLYSFFSLRSRFHAILPVRDVNTVKDAFFCFAIKQTVSFNWLYVPPLCLANSGFHGLLLGACGYVLSWMGDVRLKESIVFQKKKNLLLDLFLCHFNKFHPFISHFS
jgi:hypothetical protein